MSTGMGVWKRVRSTTHIMAAQSMAHDRSSYPRGHCCAPIPTVLSQVDLPPE